MADAGSVMFIWKPSLILHICLVSP